MSGHREEAARRLERLALEPPHQASFRDQPHEQAVLARGREALDHAPRVRARYAPHRQARPPSRACRDARPRREVLALLRSAYRTILAPLLLLLAACPGPKSAQP